jgi:hypothetical protein
LKSRAAADVPDGLVYRAISGAPQNMISRGRHRFFHEVFDTAAEQLIPVNLLDDSIPTVSPSQLILP